MKKGFTLIELLVVVLIIGILAAIAVPQYQKAVEKSRASEAFTMLKAVDQAVDAYYLANGSWPTYFDDLDISIPWTGRTTFWTSSMMSDSRSNGYWSINLEGKSISGGYFSITAGCIDGKYQGAAIMIQKMTKNDEIPINKILCYESTSAGFSAPENSFCKDTDCKKQTEADR